MATKNFKEHVMWKYCVKVAGTKKPTCKDREKKRLSHIEINTSITTKTIKITILQLDMNSSYLSLKQKKKNV
jgi:hypothetical protein